MQECKLVPRKTLTNFSGMAGQRLRGYWQLKLCLKPHAAHRYKESISFISACPACSAGDLLSRHWHAGGVEQSIGRTSRKRVESLHGPGSEEKRTGQI